MGIKFESGGDDAIQRLLLMRYQDMMEKRMAEFRANQQMEYLNRSNEIYGQRQLEGIKATGEMHKDVATHRGKIISDALVEKTNAWLLQQPEAVRLRTLIRTETDPVKVQQYKDRLVTHAETLGRLADNVTKGIDPSKEDITSMATMVSQSELTSYLNSLSVSYRSTKTRGIQNRTLDLNTKKLNLEERKFRDKLTNPSEKKADPFNARIATAAKDALASVQSQLEYLGVEGSAELSDVATYLSSIRSKAIQEGWKPKSLETQEALDLLDLINGSATKAFPIIQATAWLKKAEAARPVRRMEALRQGGSVVQGADQYGFTLNEKKVSPRDGKSYVYVGNNEWIALE
jgi:hypothetical protein